LKNHIITFIIFALLASSLFYFNYTEESIDYYNKMLHIGEEDSSTEIIVSMGEFSQDMVYTIFKKYLDQYQGSLICPIISKESGKTIYTRYVYFTNSDFFNNLLLEEGNVLQVSDNESNMYLSTLNGKESNQIGKIANFNGEKQFEFRTLKSSKLSNMFERSLILNLKDSSKVDLFLLDLQKEGINVQKKFGASQLEIKQYNPFTSLMIVSFLLLILLIFYKILNSYKKIAVEKMLGYSNLTIWLIRIIPIVLIEIIALLVISIFSVFFLHKVSYPLLMNFLYKSYKNYGIMLIASILFLSIPFIYTKKIRILNMLKNKKPTHEIILFNTLVKTCLIVMFLVLAVNQYTHLQIIRAKYQSSYSNWEKTKEYVVLPSVMNEDPTNYNPFSDEEKNKNKSLYYTFNEKGAVLADFSNLMPDAYKLNKINLHEAYKLDFVIINPNYLELYPIFDEQGSKVTIEESESSYILLVPAKYHDRESEIREFYNRIANPSKDTEHSSSEEIEKDENVHRNIKIIWLKEQQRFFSYSLEIGLNDGNCVIDPVLSVLTESNGVLSDYNKVAGYMSNPLKIKVNNPNDPITEIKNEFKKYYDLSEFDFPVKVIYDIVESEVEAAKNQVEWVSLVMVLLIVMIGAIIFHNVTIYYEQNKLKLAIQQFHGYKMFDKFSGYLLGLLSSWAVIFPISIIINRRITMLATVAVLLMFEIIVSTIMFSIVEKRKILTITKRG
jgi:hypothetical protein